MMLLKAKNPSEGWLEATRYIIQNGNRVNNLIEILHLIVEIENPLELNEKIHKAFERIPVLGKKTGEKWIRWGVAQLDGSLSPKNWYNTYFTRLTKYRDKINQLDYIIKTLQKKPKSKQLFCITFDPEIDIKPHMPYSPQMPCLTLLDFKDRENKLNLFALFRSHDFGRKAYGNYIGLGRLLKRVCEESNRNTGEVLCLSCSAHIRSSEVKEIKNIIKV